MTCMGLMREYCRCIYISNGGDSVAESVELFIEYQDFSPSYNLAPSPFIPSEVVCLSQSSFMFPVEPVGGGGRRGGGKVGANLDDDEKAWSVDLLTLTLQRLRIN